MLVLLSDSSRVATLTAILRQFEVAPAILSEHLKNATTGTDTVDLTIALQSCSAPLPHTPAPIEWAIGTVEWGGIYDCGSAAMAVLLMAPDCVLAILSIVINQLNVAGITTNPDISLCNSSLIKVSPDFAHTVPIHIIANNYVLINELATNAQKIRMAISVFDNEGAITNYWNTLCMADLILLRDRTIESARVEKLLQIIRTLTVMPLDLQLTETQ